MERAFEELAKSGRNGSNVPDRELVIALDPKQAVPLADASTG